MISATNLERLEEAFSGFIEEIDLIAGTSTGGILALGLAFGLTPTEARELYERCGNKVFADTRIDDIRDLGQLLGADYSTKPLQEELENEFKDETLNDLKKKVLISSFDLDNEPDDPKKTRQWKPKFFHNFPGQDSDGKEKIVDIGLRTSAAPTFFPIYQGYIDGGVIANNPGMCALAQALHPDTSGQKLRQIVLISIGTGQNPRYLPEENDDWGLVQWASHLVSLMLEGSVGTADYQCKQILGRRYLRLNPLLPVPIGLDRVDQIPLMKDIARGFDLSDAFKWLKWYFKTPPSGTRTSPQKRIPL